MSKAIRYIGNYDFTGEGKFLWEILCQLRNFGIGRVVTKNEWARKWPNQPSYIKVVKARPLMDRWLHKGKVWGEWTHRGRNLGLYEFSADLNRSDWRLIHKHEEKEFMNCDKPLDSVHVPDSFPLPPLQVYMSKKVARTKGLDETKVQERAPLDVCLDPEFAFQKSFIKKVAPKQLEKSIYDEVDPEVYLDFYGKQLPIKIDAWSTGPAFAKHRFVPSPFANDAESVGEVV